MVGLAGDTIEVVTAAGKRTCLWTAAEMPKLGDRVLVLADLGLGVIPEDEAPGRGQGAGAITSTSNGSQ